jgi:methionine sulfoxide reductase heme-binding subunit
MILAWNRLGLIWPWQDRNRRFSWLKAVTFAFMLWPALWLLYSTAAGGFGITPLGELTFWSGIWSMAILLLALAITPSATIFRWRRLIIVRRMIGVTALVYTLAHIVIYFALRLWDFTVIGNEMATSVSLLAATVSTIGLVALGATSLDAAIQRMGAKSWNRLHNMIYVITGLALIHFLIVPEIYAEQYIACGMFFWLMVWRLLNHHGYGTDARVLAILAVAACFLAAALEAGWGWAYYGYEPLGTLGANFSLILGVSPAWKVLILGLLIALAAAGLQTFRTSPKVSL